MLNRLSAAFVWGGAPQSEIMECGQSVQHVLEFVPTENSVAAFFASGDLLSADCKCQVCSSTALHSTEASSSQKHVCPFIAKSLCVRARVRPNLLLHGRHLRLSHALWHFQFLIYSHAYQKAMNYGSEDK